MSTELTPTELLPNMQNTIEASFPGHWELKFGQYIDRRLSLKELR